MGRQNPVSQKASTQLHLVRTRGTFIHYYTVKHSKSPFFFRGWLHRLIEARFALFIELMRGQRTCSKSTTQYAKGHRLLFGQVGTSLRIYRAGIQPRILNTLSRTPKRPSRRGATKVSEQMKGNESARTVYRLSVSSDLSLLLRCSLGPHIKTIYRRFIVSARQAT